MPFYMVSKSELPAPKVHIATQVSNKAIAETVRKEAIKGNPNNAQTAQLNKKMGKV